MKKLYALLLATFMLSACGGGGGGGGSLPAGSKTATQSKVTGSVVFSSPVASTTTQSLARPVRYPQFVSPNASSVELSVNGGTDTNFDVSSTSSLCVTVSSVRNCTLSFSAPAAPSDTFAFLIFAGPNGTGAQLASATTAQTIVAGQAFNFTVALNAAIGTLVANIAGASQGNCPGQPNNSNSNTINEGCSGGAVLTVSVMDPSGAVVTGTTPYASTISIGASDPSLAATPNTITAPGQTTALTYNGAAFGAGVTTSVTFNLSVGTVIVPVSVPVRRSYLYVANSNAPFGMPPTGGGNVAVYTFGASGAAAPVRLFAGPLTQLVTPTKAISDASGNTYVLDNGIPISGQFNANIYVYGPLATGNVGPIRTISSMGSLTSVACTDMIFDPTGQFLFVSCGTEIQVFPVGANGIASGVVATQMEDDSADEQDGMAFDSGGNLFLADGLGNQILEIAAPVPTSGSFHSSVGGGATTLAPPGSWPSTVTPEYVAVDNLGTLYSPIFFASSSGGLPDNSAELGIWRSTSLPCTNCGPSASLVGTTFTTHAVIGIALDSADNVYVGNGFTNQITEFSRATAAGALVGTTGTVLRTLSNTGSGQATTPLGLWVGP
jgi:hypothetical protein